MVDIKPFCGCFYNLQKINNFAEIIAPPYDVIPLEEREEYYARPYNIINLILPKETAGKDKYQHAAFLLDEWIKNKILVREENPSLYLYHQKFSAHNESFLRKGFFALVRLEDFKEGNIIPHENTLSSPKEDRFKLLKATGANLSPVFMLYSDENNEVMNLLENGKESTEFADFIPLEGKISRHIKRGLPNPLGKRHTSWKVTNPEVHSRIKDILQHKKLYIADGHHRYETALRFWNETKKDSHSWILVYLSPMEDDNLKIFSAHRLLKGFDDSDWRKLNEKAKDFFWIKELPLNDNDIDESFNFIEEEGKKRHAFGILYNDNNVIKTLLLVSKNEKKLLEQMDGCLPARRTRLWEARRAKASATERHSPAWKHLDVSVLHSLIFSHILGFEEEKLQDTSRLSYEVDRYKTIELVKNGTYQIAFLLNPTKVEEVKLVANRREKMPGKATYFYPKVSSGFFIHMLEE